MPAAQDLKAEVEEERRHYIQQRLLGGCPPPPPPLQAAVEAGGLGEDECCDAVPASIVSCGEVPSVEELRLQVQREREAYIGRQLVVDTSAS